MSSDQLAPLPENPPFDFFRHEYWKLEKKFMSLVQWENNLADWQRALERREADLLINKNDGGGGSVENQPVRQYQHRYNNANHRHYNNYHRPRRPRVNHPRQENNGNGDPGGVTMGDVANWNYRSRNRGAH